MPRSITLEDAGLFQMVCRLDGLAHPPGYPLFTLLCSPLTSLFDLFTDNKVISGNLISAVFAGCAIPLFYFCALGLSRNRLIAVIAAIAWAISPAFWSQAIIIEVYSLAALNFAVCLLCLVKFNDTDLNRYWYLGAFGFGLALANHWPLILLTSPALVLLVLTHLRNAFRSLTTRFYAGTITAFLAGLLPYLTLIHPDPMISVGGGIHSFDELLRHIGRYDYGSSTSATGFDLLWYFVWLTEWNLTQLGYTGVVFVICGLLLSPRYLGNLPALAFIVLLLCSTYLLAYLVGFPFNRIQQGVFAPYTGIAMAAPALWFAIGIHWILTRLQDFTGQPSGKTLSGVALLIVCLCLIQNFPHNNRNQTNLVDAWSRTVLESLPPRTILLVEEDNQIGPIGYLHHIEGIRSDIELRSWGDTVFQNRLGSPRDVYQVRNQRLMNYLARSDRPVVSIDPLIQPHVDYGAYIVAGKQGSEVKPALITWLAYALTLYEEDLVWHPHEQRFLLDSLDDFSRLMVTVPDSGYGSIKTRLLSTFPGLSSQIEQGIRSGEKTRDELLTIVNSAESAMPDYAFGGGLGKFYKLAADVHLLEPPNNAMALTYLKKSIVAYPQPDNIALCNVKQAGGDTSSYKRRFPDSTCLE